jgi:peptide deformylase
LAARQRQPVPFHVIANPKLRIVNGNTAEFFEGCLSLPGYTALVPRASEVVVECLDANGQATVIRASGWYARILQHEIDHLNGAIYIDRMYPRTFMSVENYKEYWKTQPIELVKTRLGDHQP